LSGSQPGQNLVKLINFQVTVAACCSGKSGSI